MKRKGRLHLNRLLPRRLVTRLTVGMILIVVGAGVATIFAINQILAFNLRQELSNSGRAITTSLGESLANALLEGSLASIQDMLDNVVRSNDDVIYAFAYGPHTPVVHTFEDGFPLDLLRLTKDPAPLRETLILTERGLIHDFAYRPLDGVAAEIHLGFSENRILAEQRKVTSIVLGLTAVGCILAALMAYAVSRVATSPLVELTRRVHRMDAGQLDERLSLPLGDEVGELAAAFNSMADRIRAAIERLTRSEMGYRILLAAAGEVGEGIALLSDSPGEEGKLLFVNETFARLTGFSPPELLGMNVSSLLAPDSVPTAAQVWMAIRSGAEHSGPTELTLVTRQGNHLIVESASTRIEYQERPAIVWFVRDISERKQRERELYLRNRELAALNAVAFAMSEPYSPDMFQRGLREALQALELEVGWVILTNPNGQSEVIAAEGAEFRALPPRFPACECGRSLIVGDAALASVGEDCLLRRLGISPIQGWRHATVPLGRAGSLLGALSVAIPPGHTFEQENLRLLAAIGQQMGIALENARLWEELRQKEQLRTELLARALQAQEGERKRIARELHDATGQSLNAILFGLKTLENALQKSPEQAPALVSRLKSAISDTVHELQDIIYALRPSVLDDLGLIPALRWYAETRLENSGTRIEWEISGEERRLPPEIETALFRIGQEAITNIQKYANAHRVLLHLKVDKQHVNLQVEDDGVGFDVEQALAYTLQDGRGLGLLGMRERAELLGGKLRIVSSPGNGTCILVELPLSNGERYEKDSHPARG